MPTASSPSLRATARYFMHSPVRHLWRRINQKSSLLHPLSPLHAIKRTTSHRNFPSQRLPYNPLVSVHGICETNPRLYRPLSYPPWASRLCQIYGKSGCRHVRRSGRRVAGKALIVVFGIEDSCFIMLSLFCSFDMVSPFSVLRRYSSGLPLDISACTTST